ncbi:MAG TPA: exodeoxyribonuclease III [Rhodospirillaceae bacterium]|nr:exodeoxyribonuclease III [Rhodospirillaceae bacterium]
MRIVTWNINSVRLRLDLIERLTKEHKPDILCLQETKVVDDAFPREALAAMGYTHQHFQGQKSYNGVAFLSRIPFKETGIKNWTGKQDCRHVFATLSNGIEIHCVYVPAGGDIPDPEINPKFAHKLAFLDEMTTWWQKRAQEKAKPKILVGDMNIAPLEQDVWSHKQLLNVISHTPIEVEKFKKLQNAHNFVDALRHFVPAEEKLYSWWSYRARDWDKSNKGRRLDHIWVTPDLVHKLKSYKILRDARGWQPKPSDHVPVMVDLAVS